MRRNFYTQLSPTHYSTIPAFQHSHLGGVSNLISKLPVGIDILVFMASQHEKRLNG